MKKILILLLFLSCSSKKEISSFFDKKMVLTSSESILVEEVFLKFPRIYDLTDSTLIIATGMMNQSTEDFLIYLISKKNGRILKRLGKGGRGPEEMIAMNNATVGNDIISFFDAVNRKILWYDYAKDSTWFQSLNLTKSYSLRNLYSLGANKFISSGIFDNNMFCYLNLTESNESYYLEYPLLPDISTEKQKESILARSYAYIGEMVKNPVNSKLAYFGFSAGYFQIIEADDSNVRNVAVWNFEPPKGKVVFKIDANVWASDSNSNICFLGGTSSEKFIYLLYSGKKMKDEGYDKSKTVFVFDWEGNKIKTLELDTEVYAISVDKLDSEIYGFTINNKALQNEIIKYSL